MPDQYEENAITRRLVQLGEKWWEFEQNSEAPLGIWKVAYDEARMIDAFVLFEDTNAGEVPSIFMNFNYDFRSRESYSGDLIDDFFERINHQDSQKALKEGGVLVELLEQPTTRDQNSWMQTLSNFGNLIEHLEGSIVAYLNPKRISDPEAWVNWIADLLEQPVPANVRFMLKAEDDGPTFEVLSTFLAEKIEILEPNLNMGEAMQEVFEESTKENPNHPGVKFQKAFMQVGQLAGKKQMSEAEQYATKALAIAKEQKWPHLEAAAWMSLGGGYIGTKEFDKAIKRYEEARVAGHRYIEEEPSLGRQLEVQALFGIAGCFLGQQDYKSGEKYYAEAGPIAEVAEKDFLTLEAWRMAGFCSSKQKDHYSSWDYYQKAMKVGRKMEEKQRQASTLPYVGEALLELCTKVGEDKKKYELEDELNALLGENWQEQTQITK